MYYEVQVLFIEEVQVKNGTKEKKVRRNYLVECDACSVAENKVREWLILNIRSMTMDDELIEDNKLLLKYINDLQKKGDK